jgi:uncharacterized protein YodC (DUF2158 family)
MEHEHKEGDTVRLKSGGPDMTISGIGMYGMGSTTKRALCVWFDGKKRYEELFELHTLEPARTHVGTAKLVRG